MRGCFRLLVPRHVPTLPQKQYLRRNVSTSNDAVAALVVDKNPSCLQELVRHGPGDGVIKLNVGGKEFLTLRSTVQSNAVLADYVSRAEANSEYNGTAIFIDRDPTHFGMILTFLRNKMEGIAYNSKFYPAPLAVKVPTTAVANTRENTTTTIRNNTNNTHHCHKFVAKLNKKPKYVRLPTDQGVLQDLYVEACHYQMYDLQSQLCEATLITSVISSFGGGGNPYQQAQEWFKQVRNWVAALAVVGTTTTTGGAIMTLPEEWKTTVLGSRWFSPSSSSSSPQRLDSSQGNELSDGVVPRSPGIA
jgi:hypothetical protein